jgi:hypothetical protein
MIGVFATSSTVLILGAIIVKYGIIAALRGDLQLGTCYFMAAACIFLILIVYLLGSILSLLFYAGSKLELLAGNESPEGIGRSPAI